MIESKNYIAIFIRSSIKQRMFQLNWKNDHEVSICKGREETAWSEAEKHLEVITEERVTVLYRTD